MLVLKPSPDYPRVSFPCPLPLHSFHRAGKDEKRRFTVMEMAVALTYTRMARVITMTDVVNSSRATAAMR